MVDSRRAPVNTQSEMLGITGMRWYFAMALECNSMVVNTLSWRGMLTICQETHHADERTYCWYYRHELHRLDGPAVQRVSTIGLGTTNTWYVNGMKHRRDGPAREFGNDGKEWFLHDKLRRLDGPAVEIFGGRMWYFHGELHRLDGPAIEDANGRKEWWVNGKLHRLGGPAIEDNNGANEWWIDGARQY